MVKCIVASLLILTSVNALAETTLSCQVKGTDGINGETAINETVTVVIEEKPLAIQIKGSKQVSASLSEVVRSVKNESNEDEYKLQFTNTETCNVVGGTKPGSSVISININRKSAKISVTNAYCSVKASYAGDCTKSGNKF